MAVAPNKRSVMTLYSTETDPQSHRVRIVLAEKGVHYETIDVDTTANAREELAEYNPYNSTPTLVDRDLTLFQSEVIMEYLDERFPHPPLMPVYPVARARTRLMINRVNRDWFALMNLILYADETKVQNEAKKDLKASLTSVAPVFAEMPFFMSEDFSLVDCCIGPLLWRLPLMGIELPSQAKPVLDYANRLFERAAFQSSLTHTEKNMR